MHELTPWFEPHQKPVHVGEYNATIYPEFIVTDIRRYWNGLCWSDYYFPGERHPRNLANQAAQDRIYWRGLITPHGE